MFVMLYIVGHYMYIESSDGNMFHKAFLQSDVLPDIPMSRLGTCKVGSCKMCYGRLFHSKKGRILLVHILS